MLWPSRRFVVAALALGTAPLVGRAMAEERPDPWKSVARYELEYRVRLRALSPAPQEPAPGRPSPADRALHGPVPARPIRPSPEGSTGKETMGTGRASPEARPWARGG